MDAALPVDVVKSDMVRGIGPLWVIDKRLAYHAHPDYTGRLLSGLKYDREGKIQTIGERDLPFVSVLWHEDSEGYGVGRHGADGPFIQSDMTFSLLIAAKREYGLFLRDPVSAITEPSHDGMGALEWLLKVRDAIECRAEEPPLMDWTLEATVERPLLFRASVKEISELAWSYQMDIEVHIEQIARAKRSAVSSFSHPQT